MPVKRILALVLLLIAVAPETFAQAPRFRRPGINPKNTAVIADFLQNGLAFANVITVSSGGEADFSSIGQALAYVADQPGRGTFSRWLVLVYPGVASASGLGQYDEQPASVPSFTTVQGVTSPWQNGSSVMGVPVIHPTNSSGTFWTLGANASLQNLMIHVANISGTTVVLDVIGAGNPVNFTNLAVYGSSGLADHPLDLLKVSGGSLVAHNLHLFRSGANTATRGLVVASSSTGATLYGGRIDTGAGSPAAVENLSSSAVLLHFTRLGNSAAQLKRTGSGSITTQGVSYTTGSGTIDNNPVLTAFGTSLPSACGPGTVFVDTGTTKRLCACTDWNTWKCVTIN